MPNDLKQLPLFSNLSDEQIAFLSHLGKEIHVEEGEVLFHEGDAPKGLYVLLDGSLQITKWIGAQEVILDNHGPGTFVGEISLLTGAPHMATGRATSPSLFLVYEASHFRSALNASPVIAILLSTTAERLRNTEALVQHHEKVSALGKLAAGLAHELNNPASVSLRAAKHLNETLLVLQSLLMKLDELNVSGENLKYLSDYQASLISRAAQNHVLDPLTQSDMEEEIAEWLEGQGVQNSWKLAPTLLSAGMDINQMTDLQERVGGQAFGDVLAWLRSMLTVAGLLKTIEHSTNRINELVNAVKAYSYMDQSPLQEVDLHEGLENTLIVLGHKMRDMKVTREYDPNLPRLTVYGSELNQVWTNIIDNAIYAVGGHGHLWIRTRWDDERVMVEIADDGPGIPTEIQSRIFEPFFTTKKVGEGAGIGLDIAYRIIVDRHHGQIRMTSKPGDTRFQIYLPVHRDR